MTALHNTLHYLRVSHQFVFIQFECVCIPISTRIRALRKFFGSAVRRCPYAYAQHKGEKKLSCPGKLPTHTLPHSKLMVQTTYLVFSSTRIRCIPCRSSICTLQRVLSVRFCFCVYITQKSIIFRDLKSHLMFNCMLETIFHRTC